ncbi:uncharacterized protein LOC133185923 isoform X1 [Saccostrea echinata]|uniref:uncharacterized protein LOC133185923 isoform X1 n=1 Tax=Saccostrea echinata TaxID=191078 RepID=UPI002A7F8C77|nr:uncharacterized protein LOC133185923 isoform X1 [Saccostrea echinata]
MTNITCQLLHNKINCNGTIFVEEEEPLTYNDEWFWIYLGIYVGLVLVAGLMSGLTMGLLSLDLMTLKIMKEGGTQKQQKQAKKILPIVKKHHLLLVTLLLANAAAVEAMPIFLDRISSPVIAILVSVTAVLIFGEVVPQAICTRFGLAIGATLAPIVYVLMALLFIVAWPLSKLLDCVLGEDHGTFFRRAQLKVLVDLHGPNSEANIHHTQDEEDDEPLTIDEVLIIKGALDMKNKTVKDAMLPLCDVFMVDADAVMDKSTMSKILHQAHSRVPVYEHHASNVVGLLLVKNYIMLNPEDKTPVRELLKNECTGNLLHVNDDMPLYDLLNMFQTGKSHLAFVRKHTQVTETDEGYEVECLPESNEIIGIITLEDVIEELIQEEIIDETDVYVDIHQRIQVARAKSARRNMLIRLHSREHDRSNLPSASTELDDLACQAMIKSKSQPALKRSPIKRMVSGSLPEDSNMHPPQEDDDQAPLLRSVVFT